ncbi:ATP-binding cassette domain-containing protein [Streptomyces caniscabiei]|uniref:ATP-binding cassette domain-containing protein n=1 Tax=Streptomyces caniscabiei TaxID=2746961 RepID=UPI0029B7E573|nr:ATP-binding cassette domain-containing protein [Streptomyces caniscabiei]MDX2775975.1 ATP-binding cassette domain-containing protein [Streptomyces caniscabiei]
MAEKPAIIVKDIKKSFKNVPVLKGVSFSVEKGSVFALLGSNGAGKTTTINILTTLLNADSGTATVNGFDATKQADDVRKQIGLTGQFAAVDDMLTGRENLIMFAKLWHLPNPKKIAADLLATFNLEEAADRAAMTYSGGMRRRLDIALSLIGTPPIIFLDEPTTGLDPQSRNAMWDVIRDMTKRGTTVFLTTQYLDEADQLADTIAILHEGRIVTQGTPSHLKRHIAERHMELKFNTETMRSAAKKLLKTYGVTENATENTLTVTTDGSAAAAMAILQALQKQNITVDEFAQKQPSLDDVFLNIVTNTKEQV